MTQKATTKLKFRRRREGKTNYVKRLSMVKSGQTRIVVRKTNKYVSAQGINYFKDGDKVVNQANSKELTNYGWDKSKKNVPAAYLTGFLFGKRASENKLETGILDIGFNSPVHGNICFAVLKGMLDAGLKIPFEEKALPKENRLFGEHIDKGIRSLVEKVIANIEKGSGK
jgi:large subunit ribosomal protein L18